MPDNQPHGRLWHIFNRLGMHHHTAHWRVVHYGFFSSVAFAFLMLLQTFNWDPLESHYVLIAVIYLLFQLAEILTRDALNWGEVIEGAGFALLPSMAGLIALIHDGRLMTPDSLQVMILWTVMAWTCFAFGLSIGVKMPTVASRRSESIAPQS